MLLDQIRSDLNSALKSKDQGKVDTLRFLLGAIHDLEITKYPPSKGGKITDDDVVAVIQKQVKTHKESMDMFAKGSRQDLVEREGLQLRILESYLPKQMSDSDIRSKVEEMRKNNPEADFGKLMKLVMGELRGKADGSVVSQVVKEVLSS